MLLNWVPNKYSFSRDKRLNRIPINTFSLVTIVKNVAGRMKLAHLRAVVQAWFQSAQELQDARCFGPRPLVGRGLSRTPLPPSLPFSLPPSCSLFYDCVCVHTRARTLIAHSCSCSCSCTCSPAFSLSRNRFGSLKQAKGKQQGEAMQGFVGTPNH
jgi:hypothetical protein